MEEIQTWLDGARSYRVGRVLYSVYGADAELKALFATGPTEWNVAKLAECLQALASGNAAATPEDTYAEMPKGEDSVLQALHLAWQPLYQQMNYLRHECEKYPNDDAASEAAKLSLAHQILDLEQQCMAIWARREYYQKEGKLPEVKAKAAQVLTDPLALGRRMEALKRNIRRNKQKAKEQPENAKYAAYVKEDEAELEALVNGK